MKFTISLIQTNNIKTTISTINRNIICRGCLVIRVKRFSPERLKMRTDNTILQVSRVHSIKSDSNIRVVRVFKIVIINPQIRLIEILRQLKGLRINMRTEEASRVRILISRSLGCISRKQNGCTCFRNASFKHINKFLTVGVTVRNIESEEINIRINSQAPAKRREPESTNIIEFKRITCKTGKYGADKTT